MGEAFHIRVDRTGVHSGPSPGTSRRLGGEFRGMNPQWPTDARCVGHNSHFLDRNFGTGEIRSKVSVKRADFIEVLNMAEAG